ncbi:hypothetical protein K450DRAFT_248339 [Umbelopsis ramanniana AG]|uniref:Uncharacterized protein n=1 Tax=Umbelopsis ramanniana AG TaxID=1314678 RepID=A0AAD5HBL7_UMBRA|nr:uncharacterized protein K450DRAFT_248339 [Umbelopsis ramanniana AG]KAI8578147.1 hypothetical protein K450DRAFT_248339 [Umbelopsis ramanniana AG]
MSAKKKRPTQLLMLIIIKLAMLLFWIAGAVPYATFQGDQHNDLQDSMVNWDGGSLM